MSFTYDDTTKIVTQTGTDTALPTSAGNGFTLPVNMPKFYVIRLDDGVTLKIKGQLTIPYYQALALKTSATAGGIAISAGGRLTLQGSYNVNGESVPVAGARLLIDDALSPGKGLIAFEGNSTTPAELVIDNSGIIVDRASTLADVGHLFSYTAGGKANISFIGKMIFLWCPNKQVEVELGPQTSVAAGFSDITCVFSADKILAQMQLVPWSHKGTIKGWKQAGSPGITFDRNAFLSATPVAKHVWEMENWKCDTYLSSDGAAVRMGHGAYLRAKNATNLSDQPVKLLGTQKCLIEELQGVRVIFKNENEQPFSDYTLMWTYSNDYPTGVRPLGYTADIKPYPDGVSNRRRVAAIDKDATTYLYTNVLWTDKASPVATDWVNCLPDTLTLYVAKYGYAKTAIAVDTKLRTTHEETIIGVKLPVASTESQANQLAPKVLIFRYGSIVILNDATCQEVYDYLQYNLTVNRVFADTADPATLSSGILDISDWELIVNPGATLTIDANRKILGIKTTGTITINGDVRCWLENSTSTWVSCYSTHDAMNIGAYTKSGTALTKLATSFDLAANRYIGFWAPKNTDILIVWHHDGCWPGYLKTKITTSTYLMRIDAGEKGDLDLPYPATDLGLSVSYSDSTQELTYTAASADMVEFEDVQLLFDKMMNTEAFLKYMAYHGSSEVVQVLSNKVVFEYPSVRIVKAAALAATQEPRLEMYFDTEPAEQVDSSYDPIVVRTDGTFVKVNTTFQEVPPGMVSEEIWKNATEIKEIYARLALKKGTPVKFLNDGGITCSDFVIDGSKDSLGNIVQERTQ
ncbi:hypothetical protein [Thiolapillus sp.]|uniref:hypothetical protein n=1 Tax=Thiolapillus sp. TaxID=2017437 RepID=UPI003AF72208